MPITPSAKKALKQNVARRKRNLQKKEAYKKAVKEYKKLLASKDLDRTKEALKKAYQALDKAVKGKVIKKNKASRLKSRLSKMIKK